jgi:hypothetical protein
MFIRETQKSKNGKKYIQHQLVESIRTSNGPRQRLVLNLGFLKVDKEKWKILANTIESELHGQKRIFSEGPEIEQLAKHYARIIIKERLVQQKAADKVNEQVEQEYRPSYERVDINSVTTSDSRTIGAEHIVTSAMQSYGVDKILKELEFSDSQIDYAKILIASRLVHPGSERETVRWVNENSAICELLGTDVTVYDNALHRVACQIMDSHTDIEDRLSRTAREIFDLRETVILYDLTNTYFEGSKQGSKISKPGKSKERRNDRPLVTLALTVDGDGFPKQSRILDGNVSEPGTLGHILDELSGEKNRFNPPKTIVIDAGIASEENIALINSRGLKYVAVSRRKSYGENFWDGSIEKQIRLSDGHPGLKVKLVKNDEEAFLHCHSKLKEEKEKAILAKKMEKFEKELLKMQDGINKKVSQKKYERIVERIGRIKERYGVGSLYSINLEKAGDKVIKIDFNKNPNGIAKESKSGDYVLRTNRLDLTENEISKIHRSLTIIEDSFRSMKSHLGLRPIHHKKDYPTTAHMFITVIAYHILAGILKKLRENGIDYNWSTIRNILSSHVRVTTTFNTEDGSVINLRNCTTLTLKQKAIYTALNIKHQPLKRAAIKIPLKTTCSDEKFGRLCITN